jgi:hypothetical protein
MNASELKLGIIVRGPVLPEPIEVLTRVVKANPDRILWGSDWPHLSGVPGRIHGANRIATSCRRLPSGPGGRGTLNKVQRWLPNGAGMVALEDIRPGSRLRGLDPEGVAEVVQIARFGPDALNLVFRVNGRVGERLIYRGEETSFEQLEAGRAYAFDADAGPLPLARLPSCPVPPDRSRKPGCSWCDSRRRRCSCPRRPVRRQEKTRQRYPLAPLSYESMQVIA